MKKIAFGVVAALLSASAAIAQTEAPKTTQTTPAVSNSGEQNPGAPVAGKNSFTEAQAKSRIEEAGYTDVSGLKLDDQGVWRAMGSKDGKHGNVALDFQGNITMAQ
ncbi:PepSY domain-containing protein [Neorhizobium sp. JUb45]|uniref:PepSY domain-containing protein n=1 Tax=unclassified Neorhizobium TaxID=2629175 RepID=UPI00104D11A4|nr:PepSY domain-containing protein [Neorhizobium sp. JUb45]TCQ96373.1 YpeB-like protein with putative protease inhibitory function [Neorhizobium sp. JUb45]